MNSNWTIIIILAVAPLQVIAEAERSVDTQGNVTYSDKPVAGSVKSDRISIDAPAPSPDRINESKQDSQQIIDKANRSQQQRDTASKTDAQRNKTSGQQVENARKQLEKSKVVGEGDRKGKAGGGTRLTPEYHERVKAAEDNLKRAQDAAK